jgi:hypothetical protein
METAERGLESVLTWEVEQELTEFVSKEGFRGGSGRPAPAPRNSSNTNGRQQASSPLPPIVSVNSPTGEFGQASNPTSTATTPARQRTGTFNNNNADDQSIRSGRAGSFNSSRHNEPKSGGGGFLSAFKSGSKADRRKSTAVQQQQQRQALNGGDSDEERDAFRSSGSASLGRPSRDRQQSGRSAGNASDDDDFDASSNRGGGGGGLRAGNAGKSKRDSFMPGFLKRKTTSARRDSFSEQRQSQRETTPRTNSGLSDTTYSAQPRTASAQTTSFSNYGNQPMASPTNFDETEEIMTPPIMPDHSRSQQQQQSQSLNPFAGAMGGAVAGSTGAAAVQAIAAAESSNERRVDEQGYTVPPADYNKPAWQTNAGNGGNLMDLPESDDE